jgi:hypothetical protein
MGTENKPIILDKEIEEQAHVDANTDIEQEMPTKYSTQNEQHNLQPRRLRNYGHQHTTLESTVMTQHSAKKGLTIYGDAGIQAILKELQQLNDRKVMEPKGINEIAGK